MQFYISRNSNLLNFSQLQLPDYDDYSHIISKVKDSSPGFDGIPYSVYRANKKLAARIFENHTEYMANESEPEHLENFNRCFILV